LAETPNIVAVKDGQGNVRESSMRALQLRAGSGGLAERVTIWSVHMQVPALQAARRLACFDPGL
jgi:hypothetical protein